MLKKQIDILVYKWLNLAMISVKVGELRNHLSAYLRKVRQGLEVVIFDRHTPIGKLIPHDQEKDGALTLIDPMGGYKGLANLSFRPCRPFAGAVETLLAERKRR